MLNEQTIKQYVLKQLLKGYFLKGCEASPSKTAIRFDVFAIRTHWDKPSEVRIYEIKTSRRDFQTDKKWQKYLPYCTQFYFVAPEGAIKLEELPEKIGLIEVSTTKHCEHEYIMHVFKRQCKRLREALDDKRYIELLEGILGRYIKGAGKP